MNKTSVYLILLAVSTISILIGVLLLGITLAVKSDTVKENLEIASLTIECFFGGMFLTNFLMFLTPDDNDQVKAKDVAFIGDLESWKLTMGTDKKYCTKRNKKNKEVTHFYFIESENDFISTKFDEVIISSRENNSINNESCKA